MKLEITKGVMNITDKSKEVVEAMANKLVNDNHDICIAAEGEEEGEYFITLGYQSKYNTVAEMTEAYRSAKRQMNQ